MKRSMTLLSMAGAAAAIYFLDPKRGEQRRAMVKDKVASAVRGAKSKIQKHSRELGHRQYAASSDRQF